MPFTGQIKRSTTHGNTPTLAAGELGVNLTDGLLWTGTGSGLVQLAAAALFASQAAATFYAAPAGGAGVPSFRAIAAADLGSLANYGSQAYFLRSDGAFTNGLTGSLGLSGSMNCPAVYYSPASSAAAATGYTWFDSAQKCLACYEGWNVYRTGLTYSQVAVGTLSAPSGTSLLNGAGAAGGAAGATCPAGFFNVAGRVLRVRARGFLTTGTAAQALALAVYWGTTVVASTPTFNVGTSQTNIPWSFEADVVVKATGTSGKLDAGGLCTAWNLTAPVANCASIGGTLSPQAQATIDLTAGYFLDFRAYLAGTGNSISLSTITYEILG